MKRVSTFGFESQLLENLHTNEKGLLIIQLDNSDREEPVMNFDIKGRLDARCEWLSVLVKSAEDKIKTLPVGRIKVCHRKNVVNYYHVDCSHAGKSRFLGKSDRDLIAKLLQKSYLERVLLSAKNELDALRKMQTIYPESLPEDVYELLSEERQYSVKPIIMPIDQYVRQWLEKPYTKKAISDDIPVYETLKGERVRSKSEQIIADRLYVNDIPYKYECPIIVGNRVIHPDFTILRRSDRKEVYYEHCGKMDDPQYVKNNLPRINEFILGGYSLGDRLFLSFETSATPLDVRVIDAMINDNFK